LIKELALDDVSNPYSKYVKFNEQWSEYGVELLELLMSTIDSERAGIMRTGIQDSGLHPLVIACKFMKSNGDVLAADELMASYLSGKELPPKFDPDWRKGYTCVISDSVARFKGSKQNTTIEQELRESVGRVFPGDDPKDWPFAAWKQQGGTMKYGAEFDHISYSMPSVSCVELKDMMLDLFACTQTTMMKCFHMWRGVKTAESQMRPRVAIMMWTINEGLDGNMEAIPFHAQNDVFMKLPDYVTRLQASYDRVAFIIVGSSRTWNLDPAWDEWRDRAFSMLRTAGVVVFDYSSHLQYMVLDNGGIHFKSDPASKKSGRVHHVCA
jgi:hypothetical protein